MSVKAVVLVHKEEDVMRKRKVSLEVKYQAFLRMARKLTKEELTLKDKNDTRLFFGLPPLPVAI